MSESDDLARDVEQRIAHLRERGEALSESNDESLLRMRALLDVFRDKHMAPPAPFVDAGSGTTRR